jgi:predicted phage-related endonuclease
MRKAGKLAAPDLDDVSHIKQGKLFEGAVAGWGAEKYGISLRKVRRYLIDEQVPGMGASLDYETSAGPRMPIEVKWVLRAGDHWEYDGDQIITAPEYYLLQIQHQMACADAQQAQLLAFINGDVRRAIYNRSDDIIAMLRERVTQFWLDVKAGNEPDIDFKRDADAVMKYAALNPVRTLEWNPAIEKLAKDAYEHAEQAGEHEELAKAAKAQLAHMMLEAARTMGANDEDGKVIVEGAGYRITNYAVEQSFGRPLNAESIMECVGGRKGFRVCKISRPKQKASKK